MRYPAPGEETELTSTSATPELPADDEPDLEFEQLLVDVKEDPAAQAVYQDTMQRAALLAAGPAIRKYKSLTQKDIASIMGTSQSAVSDLESGRAEPQLRTLQRYARALGRRFDFALVDQELPASSGGASNALFLQLKEAALSPLLTTLVRQSEKQGKTLQALADSLLLPKPFVRPILSRLQAEGWTTTVGEGDEREYSLVDEAANVIGVSLQRDRIVGVLVNMDGDVIRDTTSSLADGDSTRQTVTQVTADAVAYLFQASERRVLGVGVSLAGVVDAKSGRVDFAPDLQSNDDSWSSVELERELQKRIQDRLGTPDLLVAVENDANALAAWEYLRRGDDSVAVLLLSGVGIGTGFVVEGKVVHGAHSAAGEGGHTIVDPNGPECFVGLKHRGCLETMASARGILTALGISAETSPQRTEGLAAASERIRDGDVAARAAFIDAGRSLGRFLVPIVLLIDPTRAIFYADPYLAKKEHDSARAFQAGVQAALEEASSSRLDFVAEPRLEWHPLEQKTGAVAAAAAALWHFLRRPTHWAPSFLASKAGTAERAWA
jgi:predicted NBD/HSP70 family sugar kinase/transcriptional regulator with XRE-family HTH domain